MVVVIFPQEMEIEERKASCCNTELSNERVVFSHMQVKTKSGLRCSFQCLFFC